MFRLSYFVITLVLILNPNPTFEHFIWPLNNCLIADYCNHTWVPECGLHNETFSHYRLFIDECDMSEYNCDNLMNYKITNYSLCFGQSCPINPVISVRMGNYKYFLQGRKRVLSPLDKNKKEEHENHDHNHTTVGHVYSKTTRPNLPERMFHGKRRFTPEANKRRALERRKYRQTMKPTTKKKFLKRATVVLKRITMVKNGKSIIKVFKGYPKRKTTRKSINRDSEYLE